MKQPLYSRKVILIPADDIAAIQECHDMSAPFQHDPDGSKGMYNKVREHRGRLLDHIRALERAPHVGCLCPHCNPSPDASTDALGLDNAKLRAALKGLLDDLGDNDQDGLTIFSETMARAHAALRSLT